MNWNCDHEIICEALRNEPHAIHAANSFGETPLHYAVRRRNVPVVLSLLNAGANMYLPDAMMRTPYSIAYRDEPDIWTLIKPFSRATRRWERVKRYFSCILVWLNAYRSSCARVWAPGVGVGYLTCKHDYDKLLHS